MKEGEEPVADPEELNTPCPSCKSPVPESELECDNCRMSIPFCIVSGKHVSIPPCKLPVRLKYAAYRSYMEGVANRTGGSPGLHLLPVVPLRCHTH